MRTHRTLSLPTLGVILLLCISCSRGTADLQREYAKALNQRVAEVKARHRKCVEQNGDDCLRGVVERLATVLVITRAEFGYPVPSTDQAMSFGFFTVQDIEHSYNDLTPDEVGALIKRQLESMK